MLNLAHACSTELYDVDEYIIMEGTVVVSYDKVSSQIDHARTLSNDDAQDDDMKYELPTWRR